MDGQFEEDDLQFVIQPYQFEPTSNRRNVVLDSDESSDSDDSIDDNPIPNNEDPDPNLWCRCANCVQMATQIERKCCMDISLCQDKMTDSNLSCITEHEGFIVNCLNTHVLELGFYEYLDYNGPIGDEEPIHEIYRYIAYRRFTRWIWHILGKKNRKVIPSCVVNKIRMAFPSESYVGFKYPRDY